MLVSSAFESGNIELVSIDESARQVSLRIEPDRPGDFLQWFHFSVPGHRSSDWTLRIENAGSTSYPGGWKDYDVVGSYDRQNWQRHATAYDGSTLSWQIGAGSRPCWFAYFAPYSLQQTRDLVARCASSSGVRHRVLGRTLDGRDIDYLQLDRVDVDGTPDSGAPRETQVGFADTSMPIPGTVQRPSIWVIARQHPGESMASWWMEGWLSRLIEPDDATSRALRAMADIHVVPNMNPDGVARGHLRTNAAGTNLNREWAAPTLERSPEVVCVKQRIAETGLDLSLDVHGDEILPYNFIAGTEGVPSWTEPRERALVAFKQTLAAINPDFQTTHGYPRPRTGAGNLTFFSNQMAETHGALAMTLEMPFKDTADTPMPASGWSPERCRRLGASMVTAVYLSVCRRRIESIT